MDSNRFRIKFLGTASYQGLPAIGCNCKNCHAARIGKISIRKRSGLLVKKKLGEDKRIILIDPGPDLWCQIYNENLNKIDAVFISHRHRDHFYGLPELFNLPPVTIVAAGETLDYLQDFYKSFVISNEIPKYKALPVTNFSEFTTKGMEVTSIPLLHHAPLVGFIFKKGVFVYLSDAEYPIDDSILKITQDAKLVIASTPFSRQEESRHISARAIIEYSETWGWKKVIVTHIHHKADLEDFERMEKKFRRLTVAYDGLTVEV